MPAPDWQRSRLEKRWPYATPPWIVQRAWAPHGADRFYNLVGAGFYDGSKFFRAIKGFMVQFGIHGQPAVSKRWVEATIPDDPVEETNLR